MEARALRFLLALPVVALSLVVPACAPQQKKVRVVKRVVVVKRVPRPAPVIPPFIPWGEHTIDTRMAEIGPRARRRWQPYFKDAGVSYPPGSAMLVAFKREKRLEVYAGPSRSNLSFIRSIAITAASGGPGPKLHEGDRQVPEGNYEIDRLNPNSSYHVSLHLNYPNEFDRVMAERDGRSRLGGAIMIHGNERSIGCVAVGDINAEDLFTLVADSGRYSVGVLIVPRDFRRPTYRDPMPGQPPWVRDLYAKLENQLRALPPPVVRRPVTAPPARTSAGAPVRSNQAPARSTGQPQGPR